MLAKTTIDLRGLKMSASRHCAPAKPCRVCQLATLVVISSPRDDGSEYAAACLHPKWRFAEAALYLKVDRRNVCARFGQPQAIVETTNILNAVSSFVQQPGRQRAAQSDKPL